MRKPIKAKDFIDNHLTKGEARAVEELTYKNTELITFALEHKQEFRLMLYNCQELARTLFRIQVLRGIATPDNAYEKIKLLTDEILAEQVNKL